MGDPEHGGQKARNLLLRVLNRHMLDLTSGGWRTDPIELGPPGAHSAVSGVHKEAVNQHHVSHCLSHSVLSRPQLQRRMVFLERGNVVGPIRAG